MTVAQPHITAPRMTGTRRGIGSTARAVLVLAIIIVALAIALAIAAWRLAPGLSTQASAADLWLAPHMVEFRQGERAMAAGAVTSDPLLTPTLVEFRRSEHTEMK